MGDTVIFGFRNQAFYTRAYIVAIGGLRRGELRLMGLFDCAANRVAPFP